jgi:hypothetical protein
VSLAIVHSNQTDNPRHALEDAIEARSVAEQNRNAALDLADKAARIVSELERQRLEVEKARNLERSGAAATLKSFLDSGASARPETWRPQNDLTSRLHEVEGDLIVAKQAHAELVEDLKQADREVEAAQAAVADHVYRIAFDDADCIASEIAKLEAKANDLRLQLAGYALTYRLTKDACLPVKCSPEAVAFLQDARQIALTDNFQFKNLERVKKLHAAWQAFIDALRDNSLAVPHFGETA